MLLFNKILLQSGVIMRNNCVETVKFSSAAIDNPLHFHHGAEILFVEKGEIKVKVRDNVFYAGEGTLVFLNNLEEHQIEAVSYPYERYYIILEDTAAFKNLAEPEVLLYLRKNCSQNNRIVLLGKHRENIKIIFEKILDEFNNPTVLSDEMINMLVRMIFISIYRIKKDEVPSALTGRMSSVVDIQNYIDENFRQPIKIGDIAAMFYMDKYYLSHIFKSATGYTVKEFLTLTRLNHARKLLLETNMKINEICFDSGFSDVNSFIGYFKREYKYTPAAYRKAAKQEKGKDDK